MIQTAEKVRENRARRAAGRQGFRLVKSRRRDEQAIDYGAYVLVDSSTNGVVFGTGVTGRPSATLPEVEQCLRGGPYVHS
jgi:hypothetical protein